jgi:hypothetical protein
MAGAPCGVCLEPSASKDDAARDDLARDVAELHDNAGHAGIGVDQIAHPGVIANVDAGPLRRVIELVDEAAAAPDSS